MKVGTDSMLLGSLCNFQNAASVLDIGTGTGVLSLMIAQRFRPKKITAIELDKLAFEDAKANFANYSFTSEIEVLHMDIRVFQPEKYFDGIITNPPFFENSSQSTIEGRNLARHTNELSFGDLFSIAAKLLSPIGRLWIVVPSGLTEQLIEIALANGLHTHTLIQLEGKPGKIIRMIMEFGKMPKELSASLFTIRNQDGSYTKAYIELTKEFHGVDLH